MDNKWDAKNVADQTETMSIKDIWFLSSKFFKQAYNKS